jgi:hypothetical protein
MITKLTDTQKVILHKIVAGATLILSKRSFDYGKYYLIIDGKKEKANALSCEALMRARRIAVKDCGNLEVTFSLV